MRHGFHSLLGMLVLTAGTLAGEVQTFVNDYEGWAAATGEFATIDFETLPNGEPSFVTAITESFNYTNEGVTFSSPLDDLGIAGNSETGFSLRTRDGGTPENPTYIRGDLVSPTFAAGFMFGGDATLEAFDSNDNLLASAFFASSGPEFFLGLTSDVPIAYLLMDESMSLLSSKPGIQSFHFAPVPESGTAGLLGLGGLAMLRRRRRQGRTC